MQMTAGAPAGSVNFFDLNVHDLERYLTGLGKERFRAQQLIKWVYGRRIETVDQMTDLSKSFRAELPQILNFYRPPIVSDLKSADGTRKLLFSVGDGQTVESVLIPSVGRLTLCVSSEVGCNLGCKFCFTGKQKLKRRLNAYEIVGQFLGASDLLQEGERITNIVFMGMGEPLDNPDAVFKSIEILCNDWGANLSRRKITVSTAGIVPMIPKVTESGARLAVSLNGADDETRDKVMPINKKWPIAELLEACRQHARATKDKVTFEYVLLKGVTDSIEDARKLYRLTKSVPCKINIIPFNEHPGSGYHRPDDEQVDLFQAELMRLGAHVLRRKTMGRDIYAACGQLTSAFDGRPERMNIT